jgi:hypothetical protein
MSEVVNLRMARKRAERAKAETAAAQNRTSHGVKRQERDRAKAERQLSDAAHEGHRIGTEKPR